MSIILSGSESVIRVGSLEQHEQAAIKAFTEAIDSTVEAYLHLAVIRYSGLWMDAKNDDGVPVQSWNEYTEIFRQRLGENVRGGTSRETLNQRLRDYARYHLWAGVDVETALSISPRAANQLVRIGEWERRDDSDEGSELVKWSEGVKENVKRFLGTEEEDDKKLVRDLVEAVHAIPEAAHEVVKNQILRRPEESDLFEWKAVTHNPVYGARAHVVWDRVDQDGNVLKTWRGDPQAPDAPREVVIEYSRKLGVFVIFESEQGE